MSLAPTPGRPVVLLIDDSEIALRVGKLLLEGEGYDVITASSGEAGLECFSQRAVDLVVTDHLLGELDGLEVVRRMKRERPQVPILVNSGDSELREAAMIADEFLAKGAGTEEFLTTIRRLISK
ncbi:MAG: response regulator [Candidatus Korobacteraceae bacterium]